MVNFGRKEVCVFNVVLRELHAIHYKKSAMRDKSVFRTNRSLEDEESSSVTSGIIISLKKKQRERE